MSPQREIALSYLDIRIFVRLQFTNDVAIACRVAKKESVNK
jgi:hypothetical protein